MTSFVPLQPNPASMFLSLPLTIPQPPPKQCLEPSAPNADRASPARSHSSEGRNTPSSASSTATAEDTERMAEYLRELQAEREEQDAEHCHRTPHVMKLLEQGRHRIAVHASSDQCLHPFVE